MQRVCHSHGTLHCRWIEALTLWHCKLRPHLGGHPNPTPWAPCCRVLVSERGGRWRRGAAPCCRRWSRLEPSQRDGGLKMCPNIPRLQAESSLGRSRCHLGHVALHEVDANKLAGHQRLQRVELLLISFRNQEN